MTRVVVDPVTRIEGHLRIEAEVDGGAVSEAWSSSTMFRGVELILKGRVTHEELWEQRSLFTAVRPATQGGTRDAQGMPTDDGSPHEASAERLKRLQALSDAFRERRRVL